MGKDKCVDSIYLGHFFKAENGDKITFIPSTEFLDSCEVPFKEDEFNKSP
jgi:hypothetical protein